MSDDFILVLPNDLSRLVSAGTGLANRILDLRPAPDFEGGHLPGSCNIPRDDGSSAGLEAWLDAEVPSIFLPPREVELVVVAGDRVVALRASAHLQARGRARVQAVVWPPGCVAPEPWRSSGTVRQPLWQPPSFLARWAHLLPPPAAGPVLDIACGSGRASVWLAERGYRVVGIDHQPEALRLARRLAESRGVTLQLVEADLRNPAVVPDGPWAVVLMFRYLQRDLVRALPGLLAPAGVAVVRTFRDAPGYVGNPQARHRLRRGELARLLPSPLFLRLVQTEDFDPDGRPAAGVVARRIT